MISPYRKKKKKKEDMIQSVFFSQIHFTQTVLRELSVPQTTGP